MVILVKAFLVGIIINYFINGFVAVCIVIAMIYYSLHRRREEILSLSLYLKRINDGDSQYDISDYREGELSMLRSELSKTTLMLSANNEKLEAQQEFLYRSLSDISHQLKTPLAGMSLMNEVLLTKVDAESEPFVLESHVQVMRLQWLVESLLQLIQLEAHSIQMAKESVSSDSLIRRATSNLTLDKSLTIKGDHFDIFCDKRWTPEVLINILNNKNRYANHGIVIELIESKISKRIRISDDGPAISMKERSRIFERFYKGARASSESVGIGLALSKEIMHQQGFKLYVEDENTFVLLFHDNTVTS